MMNELPDPEALQASVDAILAFSVKPWRMGYLEPSERRGRGSGVIDDELHRELDFFHENDHNFGWGS